MSPPKARPGAYHQLYLVTLDEAERARRLEHVLEIYRERSPDAELHDDVLCALAPFAAWRTSFNPMKREPHAGFCMTGVTVFEPAQAERLAEIAKQVRALFTLAPDEVPLGSARYRRDEVLERLDALIRVAERAAKEGRAILHTGV